MVEVSELYINSIALQNLSTRNIQNVDLNYCRMVDDEFVNCFYDNQNIVSVTNFNENITRIVGPDSDSGAFYNCHNLVSVSDLDHCTNLTNICGIFNNCTSLVNAPALPNSINTCRMAFSNCTSLVNAPDMSGMNITGDSGYMFQYCNNLTTFENFPQITSLMGFFRYCNNLTNVGNIPNSVTDMYETFQYCESLVNVGTIPNSVIGMSETFEYCSNLVNAPVIPNSVTSLYATFLGCTNLVNVPVIPNSVTNMAQTFQFCTNLVNAPVIPNNVTNMTQTFERCYNLVNAPVIPDSVTIMDSTFYYCSSLVNAPVIPDSVTDIYRTFYYCSSLVNAPVIPNSVTNMAQTFEYCANLTGNIYINSVNVYDSNNCFDGTSLDKNVYIPFNMSEAVDYTQWYCYTYNNEYTYYTRENVCEYKDYEIYDSNFNIISGHIDYMPWYPEGEKIQAWIEINGVWNWYKMDADTANNITIHKSSGDSSFTYDSFTNAGYGTDPNNRVNGVCLFDLNQI